MKILLGDSSKCQRCQKKNIVIGGIIIGGLVLSAFAAYKYITSKSKKE